MNYCPDCGSKLEKEDNICPACERSLVKSKSNSFLYNIIGLVSVVIIGTVSLFIFFPATGITLEDSELTLIVGDEEETLSVSVDPIFARFRKLTWESSNPQVAEISDEGKVKPLREGETIVTVRSEDSDLKATCEVIVKYPTISWNGGNYTGELKDDIPHGEGEWEHPNGERYIGNWQEGKRYGQGVITLANGDRYEGEFKDDEIHGKGVMTFESGDKYEGEFKDGKRYGQGIYNYANGDIYEGEWKAGKAHGQGVITLANGDRYEGEFKDDEIHGQGVMIFDNGDKYEGEFKDGEIYGQGVYTYENGDRYEGEFKDAKKHGQGTYIYSGGSKIEGEWKEDEIVLKDVPDSYEHSEVDSEQSPCPLCGTPGCDGPHPLTLWCPGTLWHERELRDQ